MIAVPIRPEGSCGRDGARDALAADGDGASVAVGEGEVKDGPAGTAEVSDIAGLDVVEMPHPARSRQTTRTVARMVQVCDVAADRLLILALAPAGLCYRRR
jgi:hypothetical protein